MSHSDKELVEKMIKYIRARRIELLAMGRNQFKKNKKRGLSMQEDPFVMQLGGINREIKRMQKVLGITDEQLFKVQE